MHGGSSPGAPKGSANGMYKHGRYTNEAVAERRALNQWIKMMGRLAQDFV